MKIKTINNEHLILIFFQVICLMSKIPHYYFFNWAQNISREPRTESTESKRNFV